MKFSILKSKNCPECGCDVVIREEIEIHASYGKSTRQIRQHCNGQHWESRTFLCGAKVNWIPNFEQDVWNTHDVCTNSSQQDDLQKKIDDLEKQKRELFNDRFKSVLDT